jgi:hypothetical protein
MSGAVSHGSGGVTPGEAPATDPSHNGGNAKPHDASRSGSSSTRRSNSTTSGSLSLAGNMAVSEIRFPHRARISMSPLVSVISPAFSSTLFLVQ